MDFLDGINYTKDSEETSGEDGRNCLGRHTAEPRFFYWQCNDDLLPIPAQHLHIFQQLRCRLLLV